MMGRILTQRCSAWGDRNGGGDAGGCRRRRRRRRRRIRSVEYGYVRAGFHVTGTWRGSLGASLVLTYWQLMVFLLSGIVYRTSEHLYVHTILLSGCMGRRSRYIGRFCYSQNNSFWYLFTVVWISLKVIFVDIKWSVYSYWKNSH